MDLLFILSDELRIVKDGLYGTENPNKNGGWDGMVGELVRTVSLFILHIFVIHYFYQNYDKVHY